MSGLKWIGYGTIKKKEKESERRKVIHTLYVAAWHTGTSYPPTHNVPNIIKFVYV